MRPIVPVLACLSVLSATIYGCSSSDEEATKGGSAVVGGKLDTKHKFAVGILTAKARCSGVLIAPNVVLTARHCVSDATGYIEAPDGRSIVDCDKVKFVRGAVKANTVSITTDSTLPGKQAYEVDDILLPSDDRACGNDIAALILAKNVPASEAEPATPIVWSSIANSKKVGRTIAAIGFGDLGPDKRPVKPTRQIREDIAISCIPDADRDCGGGQKREFRTEGFVCAGDSGSGAFVQDSLDDKPLVIGVLSTSAADCSNASYTRTDTSQELLLLAAIAGAERGKYPLPSWTTNGKSGPSLRGDAGDEGDASVRPDGGVDGGMEVDPESGDGEDPSNDGFSEWLKEAKRVLEGIKELLGEVPSIPGADTSPPKTTSDPPLDSADAGRTEEPAPQDVTPAGGERTSPANEDSDNTGGGDSDKSDKSDKSDDDKTKAKSKSSGCAASPGASTRGGAMAGLFVGLALVFGAARRRRPRA